MTSTRKKIVLLPLPLLAIALVISAWLWLKPQRPATRYDLDEILTLSPRFLELENKAGMRLTWIAVQGQQRQMAQFYDQSRQGTLKTQSLEMLENGHRISLAPNESEELDPVFISNNACDNFFISFPVTVQQFKTVMSKATTGQGDVHIRDVSWEDAIVFCERLSELPEEKAAGRIYRLPNIHEWGFTGWKTPSSGFRVIEVSRSKSHNSEVWKSQRDLSANSDWNLSANEDEPDAAD